jgi:hypothetical protein
LSPYSSQQENSEARIPSKIDKALTSLVLVHTNIALADFLLQPYTIPVAILPFYLVPYLTSNILIRDISDPFAAKFTSL